MHIRTHEWVLTHTHVHTFMISHTRTPTWTDTHRLTFFTSPYASIRLKVNGVQWYNTSLVRMRPWVRITAFYAWSPEFESQHFSENSGAEWALIGPGFSPQHWEENIIHTFLFPPQTSLQHLRFSYNVICCIVEMGELEVLDLGQCLLVYQTIIKIQNVSITLKSSTGPSCWSLSLFLFWSPGNMVLLKIFTIDLFLFLF